MRGGGHGGDGLVSLSGSGQCADGGAISWSRTQKRRADCLEREDN